MNEMNIPADRRSGSAVPVSVVPPRMTFEELRRRRRLLEAEAAIEEIRLMDAVSRTMKPLTVARSVSSFAFGRLFSRFSLIDGIMQGVRSIGWVTRIMRRFMHR